MGSRYTVYPSPRGVHVSDTYSNDDPDPYRPPRRNRYSRSIHQTPRITDVTWISSPEPTPQTPLGPPTPWSPSQGPSSPAYRPPPSPVPTVGEHMAVDDIAFTQDDTIDPYRPQRQRSGKGLLKSFWNGLKKFSGYQPTPYFPRSSVNENQTVEMPVPRLSLRSEATQYVNQTPSETDEQEAATPYTSPYARPANLGGSVTPGPLRASPMPVPSMNIPQPTSVRGSPVPVPSMDIPSYARSTRFGATPAVRPGSLRASSPVPSMEIPITVVSPSIPPSPRPNSTRSTRVAGESRNRSAGSLGPSAVVTPPPIEEGSQTLHEPVYAAPVLPPLDVPLSSAPVHPADDPKRSGAQIAFEDPLSPRSFTSTMARFRRFITDLPWVSSTQIADEYVPDLNPRSRMRKRVRQGAEPSWYNPRPEVVEQPAYLSEWDMWAMQSAAGLWDGMERRAPGGQWGMMYPREYTGFMYPPRDRVYA